MQAQDKPDNPEESFRKLFEQECAKVTREYLQTLQHSKPRARSSTNGMSRLQSYSSLCSVDATLSL